MDSLFKKEKEDFHNIFRVIAIEQSLAEIKWNSALCERKYKRSVIDVSIKTIEKALGGVRSCCNIRNLSFGISSGIGLNLARTGL